MWFNCAQGKEKLIHMFNGELSLLNVELDKFIYHDISRLTICLNTRDIPLTYPCKWEQSSFNSIAISLTFTEVTVLKFEGGGIGFRCNPTIKLDNGKIEFSINDEGVLFICLAKFMFIDNIEPYFDNRLR